MSNELFKTIEAQGRLITELRAELEDIRILSRKLVEYNYDAEEHDYECYEDNEKPEDHVFLVIKELNNLLNQIK